MAIPEEAKLTSERKARLHEVADLMHTIYTTLSEMRYVQPAGIIKGPHDITRMRPIYEKHNLSPEIIYLYSILPYIDTDLADAGDFFQGGEFFNHMDPRDVEQGRNPGYSSLKGGFDDEGGEYMYPWYTPLSNCGNHASIIVYDAREHRIWVFDQIQRNSTDPFFCPAWYGPVVKEESNWGDSDGSSWGEDEEDEDEIVGSDGDSEFWEDEDGLNQDELDGLKADRAEEVEFDEGFDIVEEMSEWDRRQALNLKNQNSLELIRSRDASEALRDINQYYRGLKEIPGQGEHTGGIWRKSKLMRSLYLKNGWPDDFDGEGFEIDLIRAQSADRAKYIAEDPLRQIERYEKSAPDRQRELDERRKAIEDASGTDEEWLARVELWHAEERYKLDDRYLQTAKEKLARQAYRDEDLPLWECGRLQDGLEQAGKRTHRQQNWKDAYKGDEASIRVLEIKHQHNLRRLTLLKKAFAAAKADAERLCPGRTLEAATINRALGPMDRLTKIERTKDSLDYSERYLERLEHFAGQIPKEATEATKAVQTHIKKAERDVSSAQAALKKHEDSLKEHGNTT
ncbi:hypothetical protein PRZ48_008825 [Zasmidium cellare]|uniref:Uncharacterized protein n=1 Tax=Zasmidium cellare TaxID=395010 RepID=A0ABR0EHC0_ZASCE|nr:hypothetical protein PRZ48_008825 [Zasmidium cellare]